MKKYGIPVSRVVRKALEEEVRRFLERIGEILEKIPPEEIVKSIRESRE